MRDIFAYLVLITATIFCLPLAHAQENNIYFDKLDITSGLPHMTIYDIIQDDLGYVWISTENGLARYDGYGFKIYKLGTDATNPDGSNLASHMEFDKKGVLWVNTKSNGLFKYTIETDSFKQYNYPEKESKVIYVTSLVGNDNSLWGRTTLYAHTNTANIWKFDTRTSTFELFGAKEKGNNFINASFFIEVLQSKDGTKWACTENGLYRYKGPDKPWQGYLVSADTLSKNHIRCVYEAPSEPGILWISTYTDKNQKETTLLRFDIKANIFKKYTTKAGSPDLPCFINNMYEDKKGRLWMATDFGLTKLDRKTGGFTNYGLYDANHVMKRTIAEYFTPGPKGDFWLNEKYGELLYFNPEEGKLKSYNTNEATPGIAYDYKVTCKIVDYTNTLWVGTPYQGIKKANRLKGLFTINRNTAAGHGTAPSYTEGQVYSAEKKDFSWFLDSKHIYKWFERENRFIVHYTFAEGESPWNTAITPDEDIYIGIANGLIFYNEHTGTKELFTFENRAPGKNYYFYPNYYPDSQGILWLYTNNQGVCSFDTATKKFTAHPYRAADKNKTSKNADYLDGEIITSIYEDHRHTIWIGTRTGGLNKFDRKTGKFISYLTPENKKMYSISCMFEDKSGRLWLGTNFTGIFEFDRNKGTFLKNIDETSGLIFNSVGGIQEDASGHIWVKTKKGLSRIDPVTYKVHNFNTEDILPEDDIVSGDLVKLSKGDFVVYLKEGMAIFNPDIVTNNPYPPKVNLESIVYSDLANKNGKPVTVPAYTLKKLSLPYNHNTILFNYVGLHYDMPAKNTYAYKLEGFDNDWVMAGTRRTVTYNNLSPGAYTFYIKAASSDEVWSKPLKAITITIAPPWWSAWWAYVIYAVVFASVLRLYILYRSRSLRRKNAELEQKVNLRTNELEHSLADLKQTQTQLIQSEKMASLGELTAGIAHEIQNPLNFVNNFSDVSVELLQDLDEEVKAGNSDEVLALSGDIRQNLEKIAHHGRRADSIVKGMLQHSRASSGQKEPTDINPLADEYLRLAYHGLRAKDKSFNAELIIDFADDLPKVNIIPQDIGRVLLNLFTNAFYATRQQQQIADSSYKPIITVTTKQNGNAIEIRVKDNGTGIPDAIKDKILQPFFTTKPTGEGTGLGLSLSYDIIVKGHSGSIDIITKENEGSAFVIHLPV